jgi:hypothetical protein
MARGLASGEIDLAVTSGTTGDQVVNLWYQPWWDATEAATWKLNAHARKVASASACPARRGTCPLLNAGWGDSCT